MACRSLLSVLPRLPVLPVASVTRRCSRTLPTIRALSMKTFVVEAAGDMDVAALRNVAEGTVLAARESALELVQHSVAGSAEVAESGEHSDALVAIAAAFHAARFMAYIWAQYDEGTIPLKLVKHAVTLQSRSYVMRELPADPLRPRQGISALDVDGVVEFPQTTALYGMYSEQRSSTSKSPAAAQRNALVLFQQSDMHQQEGFDNVLFDEYGCNRDGLELLADLLRYPIDEYGYRPLIHFVGAAVCTVQDGDHPTSPLAHYMLAHKSCPSD